MTTIYAYMITVEGGPPEFARGSRGRGNTVSDLVFLDLEEARRHWPTALRASQAVRLVPGRRRSCRVVCELVAYDLDEGVTL